MTVVGAVACCVPGAESLSVQHQRLDQLYGRESRHVVPRTSRGCGRVRSVLALGLAVKSRLELVSVAVELREAAPGCGERAAAMFDVQFGRIGAEPVRQPSLFLDDLAAVSGALADGYLGVHGGREDGDLCGVSRQCDGEQCGEGK